MTAYLDQWIEYMHEMAAEAPSYLELHRQTRRARKDYACSLCGKPIKQGTRYESHAMVYDGDFRYDRTCWGECDDGRYTNEPEPEDEWQ